MKLTEDQIKIVVNKLNSDSKGGITCPVCGNKLWTVNNKVMEMREYHDGKFVMGGDASIMPVVSLVCSQCGNTLLFNAIRLGVVEKDK